MTLLCADCGHTPILRYECLIIHQDRPARERIPVDIGGPGHAAEEAVALWDGSHGYVAAGQVVTVEVFHREYLVGRYLVRGVMAPVYRAEPISSPPPGGPR